MRYDFCPKCGSKLTSREAGDDGATPYCSDCNRYWFEAFDSCVIVMVVNEYDEIAMLRQPYLSEQYETFVAGYIVPGETAEQTAEREVKEELGLTVERLEYAGTHWFAKREQLMHAFIGYVRKAPLVLSSEVASASWVAVSEAPAHMFPDAPGNTQHILYRKYVKARESLKEIGENIRNAYCPDLQRNITSVYDTLDVLEGKWKVRIIMALFKGNYRFKQILDWNPGLTDKILSQNLKVLIDDRIAERVEVDASPVATEYHLTEHGISLYKVLAELMRWGEEHRRYMLNE